MIMWTALYVIAMRTKRSPVRNIKRENTSRQPEPLIRILSYNSHFINTVLQYNNETRIELPSRHRSRLYTSRDSHEQM